MRFAIEFSVESERDFELIFDYLFAAYRRFGDDSNDAFERAAGRILAIRKQAQSLAVFPIRGVPRPDILPGVRYVTVDRATYWFLVDERTRRVRILAVFFGPQDHVRHMLVRLLRGPESPGS